MAAAPLLLPQSRRIPPALPAMVLSFLGGYPLGAALLADLVERKQLSAREASLLLCFSVNAGPAFLLTAVGSGFLASRTSGALLLGANLLSSGVILLFCRRHLHFTAFSSPQMHEPFGERLVLSVHRAALAALHLCGSIVFFSALSAAVRAVFSLPPAAEALLSGVLEVTGGCARAGVLPPRQALLLCAFFCGFSSLSIWGQVAVLVRPQGVSLRPFLFSRLAAAVLMPLFTHLLLLLFPQAAAAFSAAAPVLRPMATAFPAWQSALLLFCCGAFLFSLPTPPALAKPPCSRYNKEKTWRRSG